VSVCVCRMVYVLCVGWCVCRMVCVGWCLFLCRMVCVFVCVCRMVFLCVQEEVKKKKNRCILPQRSASYLINTIDQGDIK